MTEFLAVLFYLIALTLPLVAAILPPIQDGGETQGDQNDTTS